MMLIHTAMAVDRSLMCSVVDLFIISTGILSKVVFCFPWQPVLDLTVGFSLVPVESLSFVLIVKQFVCAFKKIIWLLLGWSK